MLAEVSLVLHQRAGPNDCESGTDGEGDGGGRLG